MPIRKPYVQLNHSVLDKQNTYIHRNTKMYIKNNILNNIDLTDNNKIEAILSIGNYKNDKIICIFNVFYKCVKNNNISLMKRIIRLYKSDKIVLDFIVNGFYSNGKTKYTPLMCAAYYGNLKAVQLLIEHGANFNLINCYNENIVEMTQMGLRNNIKKNPLSVNELNNQYNAVIDYLTDLNAKSVEDPIQVQVQVQVQADD